MLKSTCAFTGHRPAKLPWRYDETDSRCKALKEILQKQLEALAGAGAISRYFRTGRFRGIHQPRSL